MRWLVVLLLTIPAAADELDLLKIKRIHVDRLNGGDTASQMRDLLIAALQATKLFVLTENPDRADAILRGSAEDLVFTDTFQSSDSLSARASVGSSRGSRSGVVTPPVGVSVGQNESTRIAERKHEALATVRLVNKDGDIVWSTTQESMGAKFRGASADVADKVTRQLLSDIDRLKKPAP